MKFVISAPSYMEHMYLYNTLEIAGRVKRLLVDFVMCVMCVCNVVMCVM